MEQTQKLKRSVRVRAQKEAQAEQPVTEAKVQLKYVRMSPRKMGLVAGLIRGEDAKKAQAILEHTRRAATEPMLKLLNSAISNVRNNEKYWGHMDADNLYVAECYVTEGPTLKRYRPMAKGRAGRINKRTSHIVMVLKEKPETIN